MEMSLESLKAHAFDCIVNHDKWQNELSATIKAIEDYKEPIEPLNPGSGVTDQMLGIKPKKK
jgi:hypothetical protein